MTYSRKNKKQVDYQTLTLLEQLKEKELPDFTPPHSLEIEEMILCTLLLLKDAIEIAENYDLRPSAFYKEEHQIIYTMMLELKARQQGIDIITVFNQIKVNNLLDKVSLVYLTGLTNRVGSGGNLATHIMFLKEHEIRRNVIFTAKRAIVAAVDNTEDVFDLLESFINSADDLVHGRISKPAITFDQMMQNTLDEIQKRVEQKQKGETIGLPFGIGCLDYQNCRLEPGNLVYIGGRPGTGKSAVLSTTAIHNAKLGKNVLYFDLEMKEVEQGIRVTSRISGISSSKMKDGFVDQNDIAKIFSAINEQKIKTLYYYDDKHSLESILNCIRLHRKTKKIDLIIIDYTQLVTTTGSNSKNREQEIAYISRTLKKEAKEAAIMAGVQLNRAAAKDKPDASHMRESGSLEQDADLIVMLSDCAITHGENIEGSNIPTRPIKDKKTGEPSSDIKLIEFGVVKYRTGSTFNGFMYFRGATNKYYDVPEFWHTDYYKKKQEQGLTTHVVLTDRPHNTTNTEWTPPAERGSMTERFRSDPASTSSFSSLTSDITEGARAKQSDDITDNPPF